MKTIIQKFSVAAAAAIMFAASVFVAVQGFRAPDAYAALGVTNSVATSGKTTLTFGGGINGTNGFTTASAVTVTLYYNTTDGGTSSNNWTNSVVIPNYVPNGGTFTVTVGGLSENTKYYSRWLATETDGVSTTNWWQSFTSTNYTGWGYAADAGGVVLSNGTSVARLALGPIVVGSNCLWYIGYSNNVAGALVGPFTNHLYFNTGSNTSP